MIANELRIGNWVDYEGQFKQVASIDPTREYEELKCAVSLRKYINVRAFGWEHRWLNYLKPIPLTPEILMKCGFILDDDEGDNVWYKYPHHINNYHVQNDHECWVFAIVHSDGSYTDLIYDKDHFQFVHHLQNLFHSLTGEELEIKP